jgi:hypothetical protein
MTLLILIAGIVMESLHHASYNVHHIGSILVTVGIILIVVEVAFYLLVFGGFFAATSRR